MQRCPVCNGRTIKAEYGYKCMNASCQGAQVQTAPDTGFICKCGEQMSYQNVDAWGQPKYVCFHCGAVDKG